MNTADYVLETGNRCWSRVLSSPICGMPIKMMIEIAAAYSERPIRTYLWKTGAQLLAVDKVTATRKVPMQPRTEYRKEAREVLACERWSSWTLGKFRTWTQ